MFVNPVCPLHGFECNRGTRAIHVRHDSMPSLELILKAMDCLAWHQDTVVEGLSLFLGENYPV